MKRIVLLLVSVALLLCGCGAAPQSNMETLPIEDTIPQPTVPETEPETQTVRVAVIDTGFSPESIPAQNVEQGKNYLDESLSTLDTYGHGTAVAGIILDYAPQTVLVPLISNRYDDGHMRQVDNDTFARMIRDAVDIYDCRIINISAGLVLDKDTVRQATAYAEDQGVLVVASSGNDYDVNGAVPYYPAAYESVLAVGALDAGGTQIAAFSQRGDWVDLYEIGEDVTIRTLSGSTRTSDGTSYAAAKIAAAAVNLLLQEPKLTATELRNRLLEETD